MSNTTEGPFEPKGFQELTNVDAATALTVPEGAQWCVLKPNAAVRIRDDGTNPTAAVGFPLAAGEKFEYKGRLEKLRVIGEAVGADVNVLYYA